MRTVDDIYHQIRARGWAPALWAHHPPEVKRAITTMGWRPQVKQCFMNCQRFILGGHGLEVEYREGYVQTLIPMEHAWLIYKGEVLELTLDPNKEISYLDSHTASILDIQMNMAITGSYGPVFPRDLAELSPFRKELLRFQELQAG